MYLLSFTVGNNGIQKDSGILKSGFDALGIELEEAAISSLMTFHNLLLEANSQINLTKIIAWPEVVERHYLDSLSVILSVPSILAGTDKILDVGSGFGMPGIPLNLIFPQNKMVMLDSVGKKVNFIDSIVEKMNLTNASTVLGRAEDLAKNKDHRQKYSVVLSRAVAALPVLLELTLPFCHVGGVVVAMKGPKVQSEIDDSEKALGLLGGQIEGVVDVRSVIPSLSGRLVAIRKVSETPKNYPRKAGIPQKRPL